MENKLKVWIARDEDGVLYAFTSIPSKEKNIWSSHGINLMQLKSDKFPSIKWEDDEPTEAYITLAEPQSKPKKAIDWEQRRYEIAKDILSAQLENRSLTAEAGIDFAVEVVDMLISKLKNEDND